MDNTCGRWLVLIASVFVFPVLADEAHAYRLEIERQPLVDVLRELSTQTGLQVVGPIGDDSSQIDRIVGPLKGEYSAERVLAELRAQCDLVFTQINERTIAVTSRSEASRKSHTRAAFKPIADVQVVNEYPANEYVVAASQSQAGSGQDSTFGDSRSELRQSDRSETEEVVVTGTLIHGAEPVVPARVYKREDIEKTGAATAEDFMATLPQNFGGSPSADTSGDSLQGVVDPGMGSSINLRGVGSDSTLVLIDGRRIAAAGRAEFVDISMIPLSAVERIEVMTDGASALYGSDAVGGVVNFIMRKDFSGAETRLRYGDTTEGGLAQRQASQMAGMNWDSGNVLVSYEYLKQDPLDRNDRDFATKAAGPLVGPRALLPGEERHVASVFAKQNITDRIMLSANGIYSRREGERWDWLSGVTQDQSVEREQFGGGFGLAIALGGSWRVQLNSGYDKGTTWRKIISNPATGASTAVDLASDLWSADLLISGDLVSLPWGAIKLAAGTGYREESYTSKGYRNGAPSGAPTDLKTDVTSSYAEISAPFGEQGELPRAPLVVSVAARHEDYSTFGTTTDPRYGVRWTPIKSLSLFASYGTSFKAPNLYQFQETPTTNSNAIVNLPLPGGTGRSLLLFGNSTDLKEQTADTFTTGFDLDLPVGEGLRASLSYFDIDYTDRIQSVGVVPQVTVSNPAYRSLVTLRGDIPDAEFNALIAGYLAASDRARIVGCTVPLSSTGTCATAASSFNAIVNHKLQNFASVKVSGLDLSLSQDLAIGGDRLGLSVDTSYMLKYDQKLDVGAAVDDILNRVYSPVDLRVRGSVNWAHQDWSTTLSVAYTDDYSTGGARQRANTNAFMPAASIPSWTTFDFVVGYSVHERASNPWLAGLSLSLSVLNLFDKDPPFINDGYFGLGYDPANADPRGRLISLTVGKVW